MVERIGWFYKKMPRAAFYEASVSGLRISYDEATEAYFIDK